MVMIRVLAGAALALGLAACEPEEPGNVDRAEDLQEISEQQTYPEGSEEATIREADEDTEAALQAAGGETAVEP